MKVRVDRGEDCFIFTKIPSVCAAVEEMFAAAAGELVTAVTITDVLQATVQMYCTVMHPDAGLNQAGSSIGTFSESKLVYLASIAVS